MAFASKSIIFDGVNEYVDMGNVFAFERTQAFSFSLWIKASNLASNGMLITKSIAATPEGYSFLVTTGGQLLLTLVNTWITNTLYVYTTTDTGVLDNTWHHIVITYNGSSQASGVKIYVDSVSKSLGIGYDTLTSSIVSTATFRIAARQNGYPNECFAGNIDEVAVYDKALTAAEVYWIYNGRNPRDLYSFGAPSNLVAWWRMGDGDVYSTVLDLGPSAVPNNVRDLSGNNYTGTMTNMETTDVVADIPGGFFAKKSLLFGGTNEYVTMGNVIGFERTNSFSFSFWIKTSTTAISYIISKMGGATTYRGYLCGISTGGVLSFGLRSDNATNNQLLVTTVDSFNDGDWHHVVWTYDGSSAAVGCKCYVDNILVNLTTVYDALTATIVQTNNFLFANRSDLPAANYYIGNLDEVAIYNRVLTTIEVAWIYNSGAPRNLKDSNAPIGLVAWWRLGESAYPGTMTNMESGDIVTDIPGLIYYTMRAVDNNAGIPPVYRTWTVVNNPDYGASQYSGPYSGGGINFSQASVTNISQPITYYVMRAVDNNVGTIPPTYRIWSVAIAPDYTASQYSGPYGGTGINFGPADIIRMETG